MSRSSKDAILFHEWAATHSGWMLLAPFLLADVDTPDLVPIPRWGLGWWCSFNFWVADWALNPVISLINRDAVGYVFWGVKELSKPRIIYVRKGH